MAATCASYGRKYDVKFNTQNTHLVVCNDLNTYMNMSSLTLSDETIIRQRIASHLGHVVGVDSHNITIIHNALIIMAVFYGGFIQMLHTNFTLLGEIV